jgi:hypothetical protein
MNHRDHVADTNGVELHRLAKLYDFPDFVKQANMDETFKPASLSPSSYADPNNKQYPCHNAASTWLSALYFQEKRAEFHSKIAGWIQQRLDHMVNYWRIKSAVDTMRTRWEELHKNANDKLPDSDFAYVWAGENGNKERHLRLKNAAEVKVAAEWLHTYRDRLPWRDRHTIATKILEKTARYGAGLGEFDSFIEKQAGRGVGSPEAIVQMLQDRARLATSPAHKEGIQKLAEIVESKPKFALAPAQLDKLAETVDMVDRAIRLVGNYSDQIPRPEDVIFSAPYNSIKQAADDACALTSGTIYDREDFQKVALGDVKALFGSDFADEVKEGLDSVDTEKMAELAATLPRPDAELFDRLMSESGVHPIQQKAASAGMGFDPHQFQKMAADY